MDKSDFNVVVGSFKKNGSVYFAAITAPSRTKSLNEASLAYRVLFVQPLKKTLSFIIILDNTGRWIPVNRQSVDPWIADRVGAIIERKILGKKPGDNN